MCNSGAIHLDLKHRNIETNHPKNDFYANLLIKEWGLGKQSPKFRREIKGILMELSAGAQLCLRNEPRLQVEVVEGSDYIWAHFPLDQSEVSEMHPVTDNEIRDVMNDAENWEKNLDINRRLSLRRIKLRPSTRILLELGSQMFNGRRRGSTHHDVTVHLRDHLGHVLLFLRDRGAKNECEDAGWEWKKCCT
jgi:hypothetical protein